MAKKSFWLSFDFGINGSVDELYVWLDKIGAKECGETMCFFTFEVPKGGDPAKIVIGEIKKHNVTLRPKDRLYLIWQKENGQSSGRFIAGARRRSPWAGCYVRPSEGGEDVA